MAELNTEETGLVNSYKRTQEKLQKETLQKKLFEKLLAAYRTENSAYEKLTKKSELPFDQKKDFFSILLDIACDKAMSENNKEASTQLKRIWILLQLNAYTAKRTLRARKVEFLADDTLMKIEKKIQELQILRDLAAAHSTASQQENDLIKKLKNCYVLVYCFVPFLNTEEMKGLLSHKTLSKIQSIHADPQNRDLEQTRFYTDDVLAALDEAINTSSNYDYEESVESVSGDSITIEDGTTDDEQPIDLQQTTTDETARKRGNTRRGCSLM
jgi:hypothetical protein